MGLVRMAELMVNALVQCSMHLSLEAHHTSQLLVQLSCPIPSTTWTSLQQPAQLSPARVSIVQVVELRLLCPNRLQASPLEADSAPTPRGPLTKTPQFKDICAVVLSSRHPRISTVPIGATRMWLLWATISQSTCLRMVDGQQLVELQQRHQLLLPLLGT